MAEDKKGFILYADLIHTVEKMPSDKAGDLFKHILNYVNDKNPQTDDLIIQLTFEPIKQQLKRDLKLWEVRAERSRKNGAKGGRPPKTQENPHEPTKTHQVFLEPRKPDNDNVIVNDNVKGNVIINNIESRKLKFASTLEIYLPEYGKDFLNDFFKYWTEPNKSNTKFKQELEKTWSLERRLETWAKNDKNFKKQTNTKTDEPKFIGRQSLETVKRNLEGWE